MKAGIHPNLHAVKVQCVCGNKFDSESTIKGDTVSVEICSQCHPFYTGKKTQVDQGGRLDKFNKKLNNTKK